MGTQATIFDIQKFSIHDGPGIRTMVFMKGCPLRCKWCANPESNNAQPELLYYSDRCIGCKKCIPKCPSGAIKEADGVVMFHPSLCSSCLQCSEVCHAAARKVSGKTMSVEEVLKEVEKDMVFYKSSGGGVTFSGGEPFLQPDFIRELSQIITDLGANVAVETCGYFPIENFLAVKDLVGLVLFDIKFINEGKHIKYCKASNRIILSNFKTVISNVPVIVRIPIIPGINDSKEELLSICDFLTPYQGMLNQIEILPYHNLGVSKYDALNRAYSLPQISAPSREHMKEIKFLFENRGFIL